MITRVVFFLWFCCSTFTVFCQNILEDLPRLNPLTTSYLFSSYDPSGGNSDGFQSGNYIYVAEHGSINNPSFVSNGQSLEYVMVNINGPGVVKRFWNARFDRNDTVRYYKNGESDPFIEMTLEEIFYQQLPPFNEGLTYDYSQNTGALLSYRPMFFDSSIIVTITNPIGYYHFNVDVFGDSLLSETEQQNYIQNLKSLLNNAGQRPSYLQNAIWDSLEIDLLPNESIEIFNKSGTKTIKGIEIEINELDTQNSENLLCDGFRAFTTQSSFKMKVNQNATLFKIKCRRISRFGRQVVRVKINGQSSNNWMVTLPPFLDNTWQDFEFTISNSVLINSDSITVELEPVSDFWGDFSYWMICDGIVTDSLNVGDITSESNHYYSTQGTVLSGEMCGRYTVDQSVKNTNSHILNNTILEAFWNGNNTSAINAPLSYFCFLGERDASITKSIAAGFTGNKLYNYFPMPFTEKGELLLTNNSDSILSNVKIRVAYAPGTDASLGTLHTNFQSTLTLKGEGDLEILRAEGHGKMVGFMLNGNSIRPDWLEGDERVYIDKMKTPLIYGTGTEDLFNGGDYFLLGERDLPLGSLNYREGNYLNIHRSYIPDPINFRDGITFNLERGPDNEVNIDYNWIAFYYLGSGSYIQQDSFSVSETTPFSYQQNGGAYFQANSFYEGSNDQILVENDGYFNIDSSRFEIDIPSNNGGVILIRGLDYSIENQCAKVYVNDNYVGDWCTNGSNLFKKWREDIFMIPPSFTNGESHLVLKFKSKEGNWSEMYYNINVLKGSDEVVNFNETISTQKLHGNIFPNPMKECATFTLDSLLPFNYDLKLYDVSGRITHAYTNLSEINIDIKKQNLPSGIYFLNLYESGKQEILGSWAMVVE